MQTNNKKTFRLRIALFFLFLQFLVIIRNIYYDYYAAFFWLCDFAPFLFFIAFIFNQKQFVKGLINIALFPQIIFLMNFITKSILHYMDIVVFDYTFAYIFITIFFHLASIFAIILTYKIRVEKSSLVYSFIIIILMFFTTYYFTQPESNINYVFTMQKLGYPYLNFLWIPITFLIVAIPTYYIQYWVYNHYKKS